MILRAEHLAYVLAAGLALLHPTLVAGVLLLGEKLHRSQLAPTVMQVQRQVAARQHHEAKKRYGEDLFHSTKDGNKTIEGL